MLAIAMNEKRTYEFEGEQEEANGRVVREKMEERNLVVKL